jgi:hypothetical protein
MRWIGVTLLAALLVAGIMVWNRHEQQGGDEQQMTRILARLQALEARRAETPASDRRVPAAMRALAGTSGSRDEASGVSAPPLPVLSPEQAEQQRRARLQVLEAQFSSDPKDPAGSVVEGQLLETMVGDAMSSTGLVPREPDVDCRRRTCRIVGSFAASGNAEDWVLTYLSASGGTLARARAVYVRNADGSTQARIYAARGGDAMKW